MGAQNIMTKAITYIVLKEAIILRAYRYDQRWPEDIHVPHLTIP